jgi:hypothetical protein
MALQMKDRCEQCEQVLGEACICSYECTFCPACSQAMRHVCPRCGGELVRRPVRPGPASG